MRKPLVPMGLLAAALVPSASAQIIVNELFNYNSQAELAANWTLGTAPLALVTDAGFNAPSVRHTGTTTSPNRWAGTFALTPTDEQPIRLSADIFNPGGGNTVTTVGLRQNGGINPLFEMGLYRSFDNIQTGPETSTAGSGTGIGVRTINIGQDLNLQDWVKMDNYYVGSWARFEAIFTLNTVTTRIDLGIDGTWDLSYTERGTSPIATFGDLRIHSPASTAAGTSALVDNVVLEVVPEPAVSALFGIAGASLLLRRRKN